MKEETLQSQDSQHQASKPQLVITESTAQEIETQFKTNETETQEKVEAALFVAGRFLSLQDLITLTDINPIMIKSILHDLEQKYKSRGALRIIRRGESYKMDIAERYHYIINKLATGSTEFTKSEQETLAIIAYKQPIKQSVVIKIRGNKSYEHIKKFRQLGLVNAKREGHTLILNLSEEFYEYFNVTKKEKSSPSPHQRSAPQPTSEASHQATAVQQN